MVDMGISLNIMKSTSPKCYMTFWDMTIYSETLNLSDSDSDSDSLFFSCQLNDIEKI